MRLSLELDDSLPSTIKDRRLLYYVNPDVPSVMDLSKKLAEDIGVTEELVLTVDGFVVFPRSAIEILKEGEVIRVSCRPKEKSPLPQSERSSSEEMSTSSSESGTDSGSGSSTGSNSVTSLSENAKIDKEPEKNGQIRKLRSESSSSSSTSSSSETEESSEVSSSEATSSSESTENDQAIVVPVSVNGQNHRPIATEKKERELPEKPLEDWTPVKGSLTMGDVVMYKLIELSATWSPQETEWRYGEVMDFRRCKDGKGKGSNKQQNSTVCLAPWPDSTVHPDPKHALKLKAAEEVEDTDDREPPVRSLEIPQSDYTEDGRLIKRLSEFVALRQVARAFVTQTCVDDKVTETLKRRPLCVEKQENVAGVTKRHRRNKA